MHSNYEIRVQLDTSALEWQATKSPRIFQKILSAKDDAQTSLFWMEANTSLNQESKINSVELYVLEGTYINEFGEFREGTYLRLPKEDESSVRTTEGCTVFRKINYFTDEYEVILDTQSSPWFPGQGNLEVIPLYDHTALVKWPRGERFIPHKHWGGEEILVLKGTFMDEHGTYPKGFWIRSPHLSQHYPYVEEETIIFVKTGHLLE